jgi:putative DNA primase/helicase
MNLSPLSISENFRAALAKAGLVFDGEIIADGKLHRFKAAGDREKNSWFVLHAGTPVAGAFGCWKRGVKETWCERNRQLSDSEWKEVRARWQEAEREREQIEAKRQAKAQKIAAWIFERAAPVTAHAYLSAKGVKVSGDAREHRGALALPLRDVNGKLHSLQFIGADGMKRFLSGGRIAGCFFTLADKPERPLAICEGYATGASVHEATGYAVVCAMNCGNLLAASKTLREKYPAREIIVCADNDQFTDGNPGETKATEAAKAINAKLAVPQFADASKKPTDFNDMAALAGLAEVKRQIEAAVVPKESDEEILKKLAALPLLEYERQRDNAAQILGCRAAILDKLVDAKRPKSGLQNDELQGRTVNLADVELWPEAVNGADVLAAIADIFARYVALPDGAGDALALWTAHAHCFESFVCSPRLNISSPEKGCGKTTLRDVLAVFMPRPLATENLSAPVLFRVIESHKPTVLADECDAWLRDNEELRGMFNAGHRRGGQALRCEGDGHEVRAFNVFAPAVLCGIGTLPGTLHDRSIIVRLERAKPGELRERFDSRRVEHETELCRKLARFCADNKARLEACDPALPSGAFNRLADNWRPLFTIAEIAGGDWPQRAAAAFAKLTAKTDADAQGINTMLLADIQHIFIETSAERMFSKSLVEALCAMTDRPWPEAHKSKPISETWLARRLRTFGVSSKTLRIADGRGKGYEAADFADAFERYLPAGQESKRDGVTIAETIGDSQFSKRDNKSDCHASEIHETRGNIGLSRCHASNAPEKEKELVDAIFL